MIINIKPLSVNKAWQGRRFKTNEYKEYQREVLLKLRALKVPKNTILHISIEFGFSNKGSDIDNPLKPFIDILQKKYDFNDSQIYSMNIKKAIVKKGSEYIKFEITCQ